MNTRNTTLDKETQDILLRLLKEFKLRLSDNHIRPTHFKILFNIFKNQRALDDLKSNIRSGFFTLDKAYLFLEFFQGAIIPLMSSKDELVSEFFKKKKEFENKNLPSFPADDAEQLVLHFIYTGELQECHKNNIRAWAMAHKSRKNLKINIWFARETALLEEVDRAIKERALKNIEIKNQTNSEEWDSSQMRKFENLVYKEFVEIKSLFVVETLKRDPVDQYLTTEVTYLTSESFAEKVIEFLTGRIFFDNTEREDAIKRREALQRIYDSNNVSLFVRSLKNQFNDIGIEEKNIYMFDPLPPDKDFMYRNFHHGINTEGQYDLRELFTSIIIRSFIHGSSDTIANILATTVVYKEGGVYLPMDCLPEINPDIWEDIKDLGSISLTV